MVVNAANNIVPLRKGSSQPARTVTPHQPVTQASSLAPHSEEAERAVLGALVINPDLYHIIADRVGTNDFFLLRHQYIWQAIEALIQAGQIPDYVTICDSLRTRNHLDLVGGASAVTELINAVPTSSHAINYAEIVRIAAIRRHMLAVADEIRGLALDEGRSLPDVTSNAEMRLLDVTRRGVTATHMRIDEAMHSFIDHIEKMQRTGDTGFVPTGFRDFDARFSGLERGTLNIVAASTGTGKSLMAASLALQAGMHGKRVYILSNEMLVNDLVNRMVCILTGLNNLKVRTGRLSPGEWGVFYEAAERISRLNITLDYAHPATITEVKGKVLRCAREHRGLDLVIIDGIYKLNGAETDENRVRELEKVSDGLLELSRDSRINAALVATHQVKPGIKNRQDKRPKGEQDLAWCSKIGQDADTIYFLHREDMFDPTAENQELLEIICAKARNNVTGTVSLRFDPAVPRLVNGGAPSSTPVGHWSGK